MELPKEETGEGTVDAAPSPVAITDDKKRKLTHRRPAHTLLHTLL